MSKVSKTGSVSAGNGMRFHKDDLINVYNDRGEFIEQLRVNEFHHLHEVPHRKQSNAQLIDCATFLVSNNGYFYTIAKESFEHVLQKSKITYVLKSDSETIYGSRQHIAGILGIRMTKLIRLCDSTYNGYEITKIENVIERVLVSPNIRKEPPTGYEIVRL